MPTPGLSPQALREVIASGRKVRKVGSGGCSIEVRKSSSGHRYAVLYSGPDVEGWAVDTDYEETAISLFDVCRRMLDDGPIRCPDMSRVRDGATFLTPDEMRHSLVFGPGAGPVDESAGRASIDALTPWAIPGAGEQQDLFARFEESKREMREMLASMDSPWAREMEKRLGEDVRTDD